MTFTKWFTTFVTEKNVNLDRIVEVEGAGGLNMIPVQIIVDAILGAPKTEQTAIKTTMVKIDFLNGSVDHYLDHLAGALAI